MNVRKIGILFLCFAMLMVPCLSMRASACITAFLPFNWTGVDMSSLSVKVCAQEFSDVISPQTSVYKWNGITDNIHISTYSPSNSSASYNADILMFKYNWTGTTLGETSYYGKNITGVYYRIEDSYSSTAMISQARINLDQDLLGTKSEYRDKVIMHELGHALCLRHPTEVGCYTVCVMQSVGSGYGGTTVNVHDWNNLIEKWGYA